MASTFSTASTAATIPITLRLAPAAGHLAAVEPVDRVHRHQLQQRRHRPLPGDRRPLHGPGAGLLSSACVDQVIIVLTTLVASVGAGGIPSGSFVTLPLIFAAVRLPAEKIPILLTIDWFLDRCRTTSNVLGDMTVAVLLDRVWPPAANPHSSEGVRVPAQSASGATLDKETLEVAATRCDGGSRRAGDQRSGDADRPRRLRPSRTC